MLLFQPVDLLFQPVVLLHTDVTDGDGNNQDDVLLQPVTNTMATTRMITPLE